MRVIQPRKNWSELPPGNFGMIGDPARSSVMSGIAPQPRIKRTIGFAEMFNAAARAITTHL